MARDAARLGGGKLAFVPTAPGLYYYQCEAHWPMHGEIVVLPPLGDDGGVGRDHGDGDGRVGQRVMPAEK